MPLLMATVVTSASCGPPPPPVDTVALSAQVFGTEIAFARNALARQEWTVARDRLEGIRSAVGPSSPIGAEARAMLAEVAFELGDYDRAATVAAEVPSGTQWRASALETLGLAELFRCNQDRAIAAFYLLIPLDAARGHVWLGVAYAWTGANANAERELALVVTTYGNSEQGPNARFYLAQLALWSRRDAEALRRFDEIARSAPGYSEQLVARADNWLARRTHLMRAYFSFDTLARIAELRGSGSYEALDRRASAALQLLSGARATCAAPVGRLVAARESLAREHADAQARQAVQAESDRLAMEAQTRDTDADGIPDVRDRCVGEPETFNAIEDADGCPEATAAIEVAGSQIRIRSGFEFRFAAGDDHPLPESYALIDQIAAVLSSPSYSWIQTIRLDGHTDDVGETRSNLELSQRRVEAIGAALVSRGVQRGKLTFASYGESRPIDTSSTDGARTVNRRVEIFITSPQTIAGIRY
ncbi:MAG: OmpA family protein [Deltaproteobacteria bacterium]